MIHLVLGLIFGTLAALVAGGKGRSAVGWFFGGFFLGLIGLIIVLCLSNLKAQREKELAVAREQRRLREQLKQERIKNTSFQQHVHHRLDRHDSALGLDTRSTPALNEGEDGQPRRLEQPSPAASAGAPPPSVGAAWHVAHRDGERGPFTRSEIIMQLRRGSLNGRTMLWRPGMEQWQPAQEISEFVEALADAEGLA